MTPVGTNSAVSAKKDVPGPPHVRGTRKHGQLDIMRAMRWFCEGIELQIPSRRIAVLATHR